MWEEGEQCGGMGERISRYRESKVEEGGRGRGMKRRRAA